MTLKMVVDYAPPLLLSVYPMKMMSHALGQKKNCLNSLPNILALRKTFLFRVLWFMVFKTCYEKK